MTKQKWSVEKANAWYEKQPWLRGCNFLPSTAINSLEMWQADTFDLEIIERELGWAADLGFNALRVYLHDLLSKQDAAGIKTRIDQYLETAAKHGIQTIFVLFDDCWHDDPKLGQQPDPRPGVHNSGSFQSPGTKMLKDPSQWGRLENYVKDMVSSFGNDERVVLWDIYNEPGNNFLVSLNQPVVLRYAKLLGQLFTHMLLPSPTEKLLKAAFSWARAAQPSQPLTAGLYYLKPSMGAKLNSVCLELSDIVSFHTYFKLEDTLKVVEMLQPTRRPLICTEYLARGVGNTFETHMTYFKERKIGAFNWGLVNGKSQTHYSWEDYFPNGEEPPLWYHDILRPDGSLYKEEEGQTIRALTGK